LKENNTNNLDAEMTGESFSENFTVEVNTIVKKYWYFKNTGLQFIPKGSSLKHVSGS